MDYVVDVQGFKSSLNSFIFKEVAILALEDDPMPVVYYFRPPYSWNCLHREQKSANRWLEVNFHGIPWSAGDIAYDKLRDTLRRSLVDARIIYVKGLEKKAWLCDLLPYKLINNMDDLGCSVVKNLARNNAALCDHHTLCWNPVCAVRNAHALRKWMIEYRQRPHCVDNGYPPATSSPFNESRDTF